MVLGLVLVLVAGCAGDEPAAESPTAEATATLLAEGLSKGNVEGIPLRQGDPNADLPDLVKGMHGLLPQVSVDDVRHAGNSATVDLAYSWPLSSPWTYGTKAVLVRHQLGDERTEWQLIWQPDVFHPRLTPETRLERVRSESSDRGTITGRGNTILVQNLQMQMLGLTKTGLDPIAAEDSARRIAEVLSINPEPFVAKVKAAEDTAFVDALPMRNDEIPAAFTEIRGSGQQPATLPAASTSNYARSLLGTVGYATHELASANPGIAPGDLIGVSGLQQSYDRDLRGNTSNKVYLVPRTAPIGGGNPGRANLLADFPDVPGQSLSTTIDNDVQTAAEQVMRDIKVPASVVVLRNDTGAILAAADSPRARAYDDSTMGRMAPGLAAGPVTALTLIRSGVELSDKVRCESEAVVEGRTFDNGRNYQRNNREMSLTDAIANNCVTAIAQASGRTNAALYPDAARSLGLGTTYDLGVPINFGEFPAPANPAAQAEALTGVGGVQTSALGLATMAATVQAGRTVVPFVVPGREPKPENLPPLTDEEVKALQALMKAGAGSHSPLTSVSTGTAEGRSWAVGYSNDLAIAVFVVDDDSNRVTPAQIIRTVANSAR